MLASEYVSTHLSITGKHWTLRNECAQGSATSLVQSLAAERGIVPSGTRSVLSSPSLFEEMSRAVERIHAAESTGETIAIFGDYDADGITGVAQLVRYFRRRGIEPLTYLPHRVKEGYGLKRESIDALRQRGTTLIITVDTGITAHDECAYARTIGIDVIVTDHHHPVFVPTSEGLRSRPPAYAVIHPQVPSPFPNPHLCGSGVAFMLVRALEPEQSWVGIEEDFVLAAIGTVADLVPLTGENRTLVMWGLSFIESLPQGPLKAFMESIRSGNRPITSTDLAFRFAPRINASGRMADPTIALSALIEGGDAIDELNRLNASRQESTLQMYALAETMIDRDAWFLCIGSDQFSAGLVGLIAGKLTEAYGRPSFVASFDGSRGSASLRSIPSYDVMHALRHPSVAPLLKTCGGHRQAAGCTFDVQDFSSVRGALNDAIRSSNLSEAHLVPSLTIEASLCHSDLSLPMLRAITDLEPFGQENREPLFALMQQRLDGIRRVGQEGKHLQCRVAGTKAVGFSFGQYVDDLLRHSTVDIAFRLTEDTWNGNHSVQIVIEDIRESRT